MSGVICPYDVGAPSVWLAQASLEYDRKACAIPLGVNCGNNVNIMEECCTDAVQSQPNTTREGFTSFVTGMASICALPFDATNVTYQRFQDCLLNYPGRDGGFRCNVLNALNRGEMCNSRGGVLTSPVTPPEGQQACVTGAVANSSAVFERCCGHPATAFEGGCWQYCVGNATENMSRCLSDGLREGNISFAPVGCTRATEPDTSGAGGTGVDTSGARGLGSTSAASTMALVSVFAWAIGLL